MYAQVIVDIAHENVAHTFTYLVPEGMKLSPGWRVQVPFGSRRLEGVVLSLTETSELQPERIKPLLRTMEDYPAILPPLIGLAQQMAEDVHCPLAETLRLMLPAQMRGGRVKEKLQPMARLAIPAAQVQEAVQAQGRSRRRPMLLNLLRDGEWHTVQELSELVRDPHEPLRQLSDAGLVELAQREVLRIPGGSAFPGRTEDPPLTAHQREVLALMAPSVAKGEGRFLLYGVTGSGKTEVYIRLVRSVLERDRGAIILVPEIVLTPQMVSWLRARFGPIAAVLHSRLSPGERFDEWRRIRRGDARVVIGARSAVFAPVERLGLIVVDEEHETTYLSDHHPRYDARDVARWRCDREGVSLLLASATPSILSFSKARQGQLRLLEMPERVGHRPLPAVEVVDMRRELAQGNRSIFSLSLQNRLKACMRQGEQAMLLINHRGYHSFVSCRSCGYVVKCSQCDVAMTYHVGGGETLRCHYCGQTRPLPETCPECGSRYIRYFGAGTQRVEEELRKLFPDVGIVRMDMDTTSGKDSHAKLLDEFRSGRARILVGTQMIAKGLDFPRVTLVGVVAADMTLNLPDYRARERTFQLLTQVAGRAGRGEQPGEVVIQTYKPDDPTIRSAAAQDYLSFFRQEWEHRRLGLYPPFTVLARLLVEAANEHLAKETAGALYTRCSRLLEEDPPLKQCALIFSLDQPGVKLLRGKNRWHVFFKLLCGPDAERLCAFLTDLARGTSVQGADVYFEYNPVTLM